MVDHGYKGKGTTIHLLVDKNGLPISLTSTSACGDERQQVLPLIAKVSRHIRRHAKCTGKITILEADKGYDSGPLRAQLKTHGIFPLIAHRKFKKSRVDHPSTSEICEYLGVTPLRWQVERAFAWLKRKSRRLMLKWERLSETWEAFTQLALIHLWVNILFG